MEAYPYIATKFSDAIIAQITSIGRLYLDDNAISERHQNNVRKILDLVTTKKEFFLSSSFEINSLLIKKAITTRDAPPRHYYNARSTMKEVHATSRADLVAHIFANQEEDMYMTEQLAEYIASYLVDGKSVEEIASYLADNFPSRFIS